MKQKWTSGKVHSVLGRVSVRRAFLNELHKSSVTNVPKNDLNYSIFLNLILQKLKVRVLVLRYEKKHSKNFNNYRTVEEAYFALI